MNSNPVSFTQEAGLRAAGEFRVLACSRPEAMRGKSTHRSVAFSQAIIDRGAGLEIVWSRFLAVTGIGLLLFVLGLRLFRQSIVVSR
jgi:hypothetical protein